MVPTLTKWATEHNIPLTATSKTISGNFNYPLAFQPGTEWSYGPGADWAGKYFEKSAGMSMEEWMQKYICKPLGVAMTFKLQQHPEMIVKRGDVAQRDPETGKLSYADQPFWHEDPDDCLGGMGVYTTPADFLKVMQSILRNDGILLQPTTRDSLFKPMLSQQSEKSLNDKGVQIPEWKPHGLPTPDLKKSWALGGIVVTEDAPGGDWRRSGSISWSGLQNHFWASYPMSTVPSRC